MNTHPNNQQDCLIMATAGHIDHGKTTLVKALSGINTDTTKEEQKRGMSINLGFAYITLDNGQKVGIVDVPGHEKFIKNMISGINGIDLVLLVVDVNEGLMPQTLEHVAILKLLGVQNYLVVLTKCHNASDDIKTLVKEEIKDLKLPNYQIIESDAIMNEGIDNVKNAINDFAEKKQKSKSGKYARLNIDRCFNIKGFGSVVTGTLLDGDLKIEDTLYLYPEGKKVRIRNMQVHEEDVVYAHKSQRVAINLANVKLEELEKGQVLSSDPNLKHSYIIDTKIKTLNKAIKLWDRIRFLSGTSEVMGRIVPIGDDIIDANSEGYVQIRLEKPICVKKHDRFIIRSFSPIQTIGGGEVLDEVASKHKRFKQRIIKTLEAKENDDIDSLVIDWINNENKIVEEKIIDSIFDIDASKIKKIIARKKLYTTAETKEYWEKYIDKVIGGYHKKNPIKKGMQIAEFKSKLTNKGLNNQEIKNVIQFFDQNIIKQVDNCIALSNFKPRLPKELEREKVIILNKIAKNGYNLAKKADYNKMLVNYLLDTNKIISLNQEYVITTKLYNEAVELLKIEINKNGKIDLATFRNLTDSSRKNSMIILEYMDDQKITKRVENYRVLRGD